MRIVYQNLQGLGKTSDKNKKTSICADLRNFSIWWPEYYFFVECGTSYGEKDFEELGKDLFEKSSIPGSTNWGFSYDYCDPHKVGLNNHKSTESFAMFKADKNRRDLAQRTPNVLTYLEAAPERDGGMMGCRKQTYGTRQLARYGLSNNARTKTFDVLLAHPSPQNAELAMINILEFIKQAYVDNNKSFILLGYFNVGPDKKIPTCGKDTLKKIEKAISAPSYDAGTRGAFAHWWAPRTVNENVSLKEIATYYKIQTKHSGLHTHRDGELDYLFHSRDLAVSTPGVLDKSNGGSDHNAIYFDVSL